MSKQHYVMIHHDEQKQPGDVFWGNCQTWVEFKGKSGVGHREFPYLRLVDPQPVNPWIKGSERLPTEEDAWRNVVEMWNGTAAVYYAFGQVKEDDWWRPLDLTPPPAEPTVEELVEELLKAVEAFRCSGKIQECAQAIRAKQESEGRDD